jgi:hypothetical protein
MNKIKKQILCVGLCIGGILVIDSGEINQLQCNRSNNLVNCTIDRKQWFPAYENQISIKGVERVEIEVRDFDEYVGERVSIISPTVSIPLHQSFNKMEGDRQKIAGQIDRFLKSREPNFQFTDFPLWTYLFGFGFISVSLLCWWLIPVSEFDRI